MTTSQHVDGEHGVRFSLSADGRITSFDGPMTVDEYVASGRLDAVVAERDRLVASHRVFVDECRAKNDM